MKYMGSKREMLQNGLGVVLDRETRSASRFVDLFAGSGVVALYVARKRAIRVRAVDAQDYSAALVNAVLHRQTPFAWEMSWRKWLERANTKVGLTRVPQVTQITHAIVGDCRAWCTKRKTPLTRAYGGYYFSPQQSLWLDALRVTAPVKEPARAIAIAALIRAASQCAASPGHTAQPFRATRTARPFLLEAWSRDVVQRTKKAFEMIAKDSVQKCGSAHSDDANEAARTVRKGDLVFIDPPYSGVHYSRFYHVLETIARGNCGKVSGAGRYPPSSERPWSRYSVTSEARNALAELFQIVSSRGARTIVTFPIHKCSNGLSGRIVRNEARKYFKIREQRVKSRFSSMGGIGKERGGATARAARTRAKELILVLTPKTDGSGK
jgi:adenine-specific DNA-methyltransferase